MKPRLIFSVLTTVFLVISTLVGGCSSGDYLDPTQTGRFRPTPVVNVILDSLGVAEEESPVFEGAEEPRPMDVIPFEEDYRFGHGDIVRVAIFELLQEGFLFTNDYQINETGKISIPVVGQVSAAEFTESELEEEIKRFLSPTILKEPMVTVTLQGSQRRVFTVLGLGIPRSNRYPLPRYTFRLTDALAMAGSPSQFNVSYIYVSRALTGKEGLPEEIRIEPEVFAPEPPAEEPISLEHPPGEEEMLEIIAPFEAANPGTDAIMISSAEMVTDKELREAQLQEQVEAEAKHTSLEPDEPSRVEWIFKDGRWVPVRIGPEAPAGRPGPEAQRRAVAEPAEEQPPEYFGWEQIGTAGVQRRVIKIPVDKLLGGDPRYDIVIRPGDTISVPVDIIGEFWVYGNVNRVGAIPLTGRPMTLKMAIAAAGGFGPLAWPKKVEVIRRISKNKEEIVMVDMNKIFRGLQPDFFIKPHDLINVGTHPAARPLAVLRNAFRATYGFGFVYDRNFLTTRSGQIRLLYD